MSSVLQIDETGGIQNVQGALTTNDTSTGNFPTEFADILATVTASGSGTGQSATGAAVSGATSANPLGTNVLSFGANVNDVAFVLKNGDGTDSLLTSTTGRKIFLYVYPTDNNVVLAREGTAGGAADPNGKLAFALYLDTGTVAPGDAGATGAKLWMSTFDSLSHPLGGANNPNDLVFLSGVLNYQVNTLQSFSLEKAPSGQNLFLMFGKPEDTSKAGDEVALVVTAANAEAGGTVNSSQGGTDATIGTDNQMIVPGKGLIFTFVTNADPRYTVPDLTHAEATTAADILFKGLAAATMAQFVVSQTQPSGQTGIVKISAFNTALETGQNYINGLHNDTAVKVTSVTVKNAAGADVTSTVTIAIDANGVATVTGVKADYTVSYTTLGSHNRVELDNIGTGANNVKFDIGNFKLQTGSDNVTPLADIGFADDAPTAAAALGAGLVRHDETTGNQSDADDTTAAGVAALFSGVSSPSSQMAAGYAQGTASVIDSSASTGGVDGLASTVYSLAVSAAGVDSGLDTVAGASIFLFKEGDLVVGRIGSSSGQAAFAVAINSSTGVLSMAQYNAIKHPTGGAASPDESVSIASAALLAVATVTDGDGDTNAASVAIGDRVQIQDDGPTAAATLGTGVVRHDETAGVQGDADDTTAAGVAALFSGVTNTSSQMTAGFAQGTAAVINSSTSTGGVDGLASTVYSLAVSASGVDSGLDTVAGDSIFLFKEGSLVVGRIGSSSGQAAFAIAINSSTGVLSMAQYNAIKHPTGGAASPDESLSIANAALLAVATVTDGDGDTSSASVAIGASVSIQDDGPTAAATLGTGVVRHDETAGVQGDADDTTAAGVAALFSGVTNTSSQMTAGFAQGTAAVINSSTSTGGVDGLASTVYSLAVSASGVDSGLDTVAGTSIFLFKEGDLVVGRIGSSSGQAAFAIAINSSTGALSMAQYNAIKHPTGGAASPDESLSIANAALLAVATVTDGDGDTSSASVAIGASVSIQDDGPTAAATLGTGVVRHDETAGVQGDADDTTAVGVAALFSGVTNTSSQMTAGFAQGTAAVINSSTSTGGVDGLASTVYSLAVSTSGVDSGLDTVAGTSIFLFKEGDLVVGRIGSSSGQAAFAIAINSSTGVLSMAQYNAIKHPTGGAASPDESLSITNAALLAVATVTDGDGDTSSASVAIGASVSIQDDGPSAAAALGAGQVRHDETAGIQADADDTIAAGVSALFSGVTNTSSQMAAGFAQGTASVVDSSTSAGGVDGLASTAYSLDVSAAGVDSGLDTVAGDSIFLFKEGSLVVGRIGSSSGQAAFAIAINSSTGVLSMAQYNAIKHPTGGAASPDESVSIASAALLAVATVTDGDGDTSAASVGIGARVSIQDDGPSLAFGNLIGTGVIDPQFAYWTSASGVDKLGAAGLDIALNSFTLVRPDGTTLAGAASTFTEQAGSPDASGNYLFSGTLTGDFDNNAATANTVEHFTLTAYANGTYSIDLLEGFQSTVTESTANGTLDAGGPDPVRTLTIGSDSVVFFAAKPLASASDLLPGVGVGAPDPTEAQLQTNPLPTYIDGTKALNVSTSGIGNKNNNLQGDGTAAISAGDESFVANPGTQFTSAKVFIDNAVTGYDFAGGERLYYRLIFSDGTDSGLVLVNQNVATTTHVPEAFTVDGGGKLIDALQLTMATGTVKVPEIQFITKINNLANGIKLDFTATLTDGDGDTASSSFLANLSPNQLGTFDYVLTGVSGKADAFDVDLAATESKYQVNGFELGADKLVLLGTNSYTLNTSTANTVVDITETGGQHTFVTVVGVHIAAADIATIV